MLARWFDPDNANHCARAIPQGLELDNSDISIKQSTIFPHAPLGQTRARQSPQSCHATRYVGFLTDIRCSRFTYV